MNISAKLLKLFKSLDNNAKLKDIYSLLLQSEIKYRLDFLDFTLIDNKVIYSGLNSNIKLNPAIGQWTHPNRTNFALGRLLSKVLPGVDENLRREFVEALSTNAQNKRELPTIVVSGEDIRVKYNIKSYDHTGLRSGNLFNSCMRGSGIAEQLDLYVYNPKTIQLLTVQKPGGISGRALIFKAFLSLKDFENRENEVTLLGRRYYISSEDYNIMTAWAVANADFYLEGVKATSVKPNIASYINVPALIPLENWYFPYAPYCDHFSRVFPELSALGPHTCKIEPSYSVGSIIPDIPPPSNYGNPNLVWTEDAHWRPKNEFTLINNKWFLTSSLFYCAECNEQRAGPKHTLYDGRVICINHNLYYLHSGKHALQSEATTCKICSLGFLNSQITIPQNGRFICKKCKPACSACAVCSSFEQKIQLVRTTEGQICRKCIKLFNSCSHCKFFARNLYKKTDFINLCEKCNKIYIEPTKERECKDSFIPVGKNRIRINL